MSLWQVLRQEAQGAVRSLRYDLGGKGEDKAGVTVRPEHYDPARLESGRYEPAGPPRRRLYLAGLGVLLTGAGIGAYVGAVQGLNAVMTARADAPTTHGTGPDAAEAVADAPHRSGPGAVEILSTVEPEIRIMWRTKYITVAPSPWPPEWPPPLQNGPAPLPTPKPNCGCVDPPPPSPTDGTPSTPTVPASPSGQPEATPTGDPGTPTPEPTLEGTPTTAGQ